MLQTDPMDKIFSWQNFITALLVAIPTSILTVALAFRRYKSEKWWDRKAQCYCETINAMNEIIVVCDAFIDEQVHGVTLRKAEKEALSERYRKGKAFCFTQINIGRLFMSEEAHNILMGFERALFVVESETDSEVIMQGIREVTEGCLNAILPIAQKDLGANLIL